MNNIEQIKSVLIESDFEQLQKSLDNYNINEHDKFGNNILHYYLNKIKEVKIDFKTVIDEFIKRGLDVNEKQTTGPYQRSPLHQAVVLNLRDVFDFLIQNKAEVNSDDAHGNNILSTAIFDYLKDTENYGYYIQELLQRKADPHEKNKHGVSALSLVQSIGNSDVGKYFEKIS